MLNIGFIGEDERSIDLKDRVPLPFKHKNYIEATTINSEAKNTIILKKAKGRKKCIEAMPIETWEKMVNEYISKATLDNESQDDEIWEKTRGTFQVKIDSMGRIRIPKILKEFANINKKVIFIGAIDRIQIWAEEELKKYDADNT
ncbi:MAG TPA: hypothetical protein PLF61_07185 [Candidatus Goldiibacteriota bacterium]|nr:hypothetical protein [Candidatus Goldiibacteriota bacterium]